MSRDNILLKYKCCEPLRSMLIRSDNWRLHSIAPPTTCGRVQGICICLHKIAINCWIANNEIVKRPRNSPQIFCFVLGPVWLDIYGKSCLLSWYFTKMDIPSFIGRLSHQDVTKLPQSYIILCGVHGILHGFGYMGQVYWEKQTFRSEIEL